MAAIAMMLGGAVINGLAFSGAGELFKMFDKNGYEEEMKRHNLAQEQLQKDTVEWNQHRQQIIDYANLQLQREHQATIDFQNVDDAFTYYNELHPLQKLQLKNKPVLSEYYQPSDKMKNYEYLWIAAGMVGLGAIVYFYVK